MIEQFSKPHTSISIDHKSPLLLLGSCFSEHIGDRLRQAGFDVLSNPYGTIFHPIPLANCLERLWNPTERLLQNEDVWLSYDAASALYALSEIELRNKIHEVDFQVKNILSSAKMLIVTFGSAHGYRLQEDGLIVANCHKKPASEFEKELTDVQQLADKWNQLINQLKAYFPELKIIITVSPVRYSRDGWVENNRSKARLIQLAEYLEGTFDTVHYFPAYELVNDLLRDYRYFEGDGVHPNEQAVNVVWELFSNWFFTEETKNIVAEAEKIRRMEEHKLLFPESRQAEKFRHQLQQKRESFLSLHPYVRW